MNKVKLISFLLISCLFLGIPQIAFAHPGGTDANGGHHDYNNVSGLGDYHYHHGYPAHLHENGVCPYDYVDVTGQYSGSSSSGTKLGGQADLLSEAQQQAANAERKAQEAEEALEKLIAKCKWIGVDIALLLLILIATARSNKKECERQSRTINSLQDQIALYEELWPRLKYYKTLPPNEARNRAKIDQYNNAPWWHK